MTDQRKDEMLNQGDDVVERLKDAAERMLNGEIIGHNLSVFATDILTILNRAASSPPVPDDVTVSREVLQGVRDALEQLMDDLSGGSMKYPNVGVCEAAWIQAELALASLDAVLSEGKS